MEWPILDRPRVGDLVEAALATRPFGAAMLLGPSGVGKSTIAAQAAERWSARGGSVLGLVGMSELSAVPLAPFAAHAASLGLDAATMSATGLLQAIGSGPHTPLLVVDDAPLLDPASAAVVYQLVRSYGLRAVLTGRDEQLTQGPIERLVHEGVARQISVGGLDAYEIRLLLRRRYGAAPRPDDVHRLLAQTHGNPLMVREVVTRTEQRDGVRRVEAGVELVPVDVPADIRNSMLDRVERLDPASREVLAVVALAGPAAVRRLFDQHELRLIARLVDEAYLVWSTSDLIRATHPLIAESVLAGLATADRDRLTRRVADLLAAGSRAERSVAVRLRAQTAGGAAAHDLEWAIAHAYGSGEYLTAVELHQILVTRSGQGEEPIAAGTSAVVASSLSWIGRLSEAEAMFETLLARDLGPGELAEVLSRYGGHLAHRRRDPRAALEMIGLHERRLSEVERSILAPDVRAWTITAGDLVEDPARAADAVDSEPQPWSVLGGAAAESGAITPALAVRGAIAAVMGSAVSGRDSGPALALLEQMHDRHGALEPHATEIPHLYRYVRLLVAGDGRAGRALVEQRRAACSADTAGIWTGLLAFHLAMSGEVVRATTLAAFAEELLTWRDPLGMVGMVRGLRPAIAASAGDVTHARELLDELVGPAERDPKIAIQAATARALIRAAEGDREGAASELAAAARSAIGAEHGALAALALTHAVRIGVVDEAADLLLGLRDGSGGAGLPTVLAEVAAAMRDQDPATLVARVDDLLRADLRLTAVDVLGWAETMVPSGGELHRKAHRQRQQLQPGVEAPLLSRPPTEYPGGLTAREYQIVELVCERYANREIAERLAISASTVDNHLTSAYRKLGVANRAELRRLFADTT